MIKGNSKRTVTPPGCPLGRSEASGRMPKSLLKEAAKFGVPVAKEADFYNWLVGQVEKLRRHDRALDWENLAEELQDLASRERREPRFAIGGVAQAPVKMAIPPWSRWPKLEEFHKKRTAFNGRFV
jgi:hypothetical protein